MTRSRVHLIAGCTAIAATWAAPAAAQPLGTFSWQLQPYCNRLTVVVTPVGGVFTLHGYDDLCGAGERATATGVAVISGGTAALGVTIMDREGGLTHVDARISLSTFSGAWRDHYLNEGTLAFNGTAAGTPRPSPLSGSHFAGGYYAWNTGGGFYFGLGRNGSLDAPQALILGDALVRYGGGGFNGQFSQWPTGLIDMVAAENWTPTANGTRLRFWTTPLGVNNPLIRMLVDADGSVGIGTDNERPDDRLHVRGDVRVGTAGTNGCLKNNNGGAIVGTCSSDRRLKRGVAPLSPTLERLAALRPVSFAWRAEAFPDRGFGPAREVGLVAQDVEEVLPELVTTGADGYKAVDYSRLPLLAVQAIRELKAKADALEARLARIEAGLAPAADRR